MRKKLFKKRLGTDTVDNKDVKEKKPTIRIGRKAIALSYIRYFINSFSNIIILPVILSHISQEEYGLWGIFLSIDAGVDLVGLGLGTVITRYVTYAYCGADEITKEGLPSVQNGSESNIGLLFDVVYVARQIYIKITFISLGLFILASMYIVYLAIQVGNPRNAIVGWIVFCASSLFRIYYTYYSSFIKGIGKIKEIERIHIFLGFLYMVTRMAFTWMGWGLLGLGIANAIDIVLGRLLIYGELKDLIKKNQKDVNGAKKRTKEGKNTIVKEAIWKNSKQLGIVTITNYITGQGKSLLCSIILPLSIMGQFSLTNQIVNAVASVSLIPYNTFRVQMGDAMVKRDYLRVKEILSFILLMFFAIIISGGVFTLLFGERFISLIKSNTSLLENKYILLLLIYSFVISLNQICTGYISLKNIQPYIKSYVVASFLGIVVAYVLNFITDINGLDCYIYCILLAQLIYNAWKWPLYVYKDTGIRIKDVILQGGRYTFKVIKGKNV